MQPGSPSSRRRPGRGRGRGRRTTAVSGGRSVDETVDQSRASTMSYMSYQPDTGDLPAARKTRRQSTMLPTLQPGDRKRFVFDGNAWMEYELDGLPADYRRPIVYEQIRIKFRTDAPNGLLWYVGHAASSSDDDDEGRCTHLSIKVSH